MTNEFSNGKIITDIIDLKILWENKDLMEYVSMINDQINEIRIDYLKRF